MKFKYNIKESLLIIDGFLFPFLFLINNEINIFKNIEYFNEILLLLINQFINYNIY
jgi:hypothetical protein